MKPICLAACAALLAAPAAAFNSPNFQIAMDLGGLLASESLCGLSYNHDAIDAYIDANVDHTDMGFASDLASAVSMNGFQLGDMTESARRAHCRAVTGTARHHGFID